LETSEIRSKDGEGRAQPPKGVTGLLVAVYIAFGAFWGVWVVVFADFLRDRSFTAGKVSLLFAAMSVVAISVMTFVAPRMEALPRNVALTTALMVHAAGNLCLVLFANEWLWISFALMGAGTGLIDVFVNATGQEAEASTRRSVLQWVHAAYGAGGVVGALATAIAITNGVSYVTAVLAAAAVQMVVGAVCWMSRALRASSERKPGRFSLGIFANNPSLVLPAVIVLFSFFVEGSMDVWSVIFLRETLGSSVIGGAMGFAAFALSITLGRTIAARFFFEMGYARTVLVAGLGSLIFATVAVASPEPLLASLAFLGLGFTLSPAAPAAFGMAEGAGQDAGLAVGAITTVGYTGFVVGPPIMGWLADNVGLRAAMSGMLVATLGMAAGGIVMTRSRRGSSADPQPVSPRG
jgi:MFS family permease